MNYHNIIYLVHLFFVCPLLMYSGYIGRKLSINSNNMDFKKIFEFLMIVGGVVGIYHGYKLSIILRFHAFLSV